MISFCSCELGEVPPSQGSCMTSLLSTAIPAKVATFLEHDISSFICEQGWGFEGASIVGVFVQVPGDLLR